MKTILLLIGKTDNKHYVAGINDYAERVSHYIPFDITVLPDIKNTKNMSEQQQKEKEGEMICDFLRPGDIVVLLDEHGKEQRSLEFAKWVEKKLASSAKRLVFIIGGPYGFSQKVYDQANDMISLSKMTFSHQMVRLIFVEQLYRAMNILGGGAYHHE